MTIALHGRTFNDDNIPFIQEMFLHLEKLEVKIFIYSQFKHFLEKKSIKLPKHGIYTNRQELENISFLISIGGDGTLLETITYSGEKEIPVLGINTGRLGFL